MFYVGLYVHDNLPYMVPDPWPEMVPERSLTPPAHCFHLLFILSYGKVGLLQSAYVGGKTMHAVTVTLLVIVSIGLILVVLLQSGKSHGLSGAISGGAEQLFGKQKARGMDAVLHKITIVLAVLFFILAIAVTYFEV